MIMNPHLTVPAAPVCAFFNFIFQQLDWRWLKGTLRNIAVTACLVLPLAMTLQADEPRPNWLPEAIELPADNDVLMDRSIGSSLRMFSFSTEHNTETLLEDWEEALRLAGYSINQTKGDILETAIEFSGQGINNAKIVVAPASADGRSTIEIDATLQ